MAFPSLIEKFLKLSRDVANAVTVSGQAKTTANEAKESAATKAPANHKSTATTYGVGDKTNYGHVKLLNATNSTLGEANGTAATPSAVKSAYDLANTANTTANTAKTTANAAMPKAGGSFTGNITVPLGSSTLIFDTTSTTPALGSAVDLPIYVRQKTTGGVTYGTYPFYLIPTANSVNYGIGLGFQTGGTLIVGSGDGGKTYANENKLDGEAEHLYLTSDNHIYFITNLQNGPSYGKAMSYSSAGNLTLPANGVVTATSFKGLATNATNDAKGQAITTYVRSIAVSGSNIVVTNGAGTASNVKLVNITGNAATATQLQTSRTFKTNLASTAAASFNGTAACTPGVTGILPVANGGTGTNSLGTFVRTTGAQTIEGSKYFTGAVVVVGNTSSKAKVGTNIPIPFYARYKSTDGNIYNKQLLKVVPSSAAAGQAGIVFQAPGGACILASGDSSDRFVSGASLDGSSESVYIIADTGVYIHTNLNSAYADRKTFSFKSNGNLAVPGSVSQGSDERLKDNIQEVPDAVLDAWGEVQWQQFNLKDELRSSGASAEVHNGVVAQRIEAAFLKHGLDALRYGLVSHEEYGDKDNEQSIRVPGANDVYTVCYAEALSMEAAYQRREVTRAKERIGALEARLERMEALLSKGSAQ